MPRPIDPAAQYIPGWDGIRAVAVVAVVGYHLGVPGMSGGLLGVGVFFTLSGFLITSILLGNHQRTGSFQLSTFWVRRARRLLPALVVVLVVVAGITAVTDPSSLDSRMRESLAALAYVANWTTIADGVSYFERFAGPSPLDHLWSLSVEEQFYLIWPLVLVLVLTRQSWDARRLLPWVALGALVSFALLATLAVPGFDNTRAYEGTDTRAGGLLVGVVLALAWPQLSSWLRSSSPARWLVEAAGLVGLATIVALVLVTDDYSPGIYRGGLLLLSVSTALVAAAVAFPGSRLGWLLGLAPLRWIGARSYGIYLWHLPVVVFTSAAAVGGFSLRTAFVQAALILGAAEISWRVVEDPIRRLGFRGAYRPVRGSLRAAGVPARAAATGAFLAAGTLVLSASALIGPDRPSAAAVPVAGSMPPLPPPEASPAPSRTEHRRVPERRAPHHSRNAPSETSCSEVVHVGDSTSIGLVNAAYLPSRSDRLPARLNAVGVRDVTTDVSGARSIVETYHDQPNARAAVTSRMNQGYDGCWTIAMGTNEAANQAVGGVHSFAERIDLLMKPIAGHPVLWLTVRSQLQDGPYADRGMKAFSESLVAACRRYPNLRVYDWRSEVRPEWFIEDGIHFTTPGYRARARGIARALATAFPSGGDPAPGCVVRGQQPGRLSDR